MNRSARFVSVFVCLALIVSSVLVSASETQAAPVLGDLDCWEIIERPCTDCPGNTSFFCNPTVNGNLSSCVFAESVQCEPGKGCVNVTGTTGNCTSG